MEINTNAMIDNIEEIATYIEKFLNADNSNIFWGYNLTYRASRYNPINDIAEYPNDMKCVASEIQPNIVWNMKNAIKVFRNCFSLLFST